MSGSGRVGRRMFGATASGLLTLALAGSMVTAQAQTTQLAAGSSGRGQVHGPTLPSKASLAGRYIVVLADQPETAYDGHVAGYEATRPAAGQKFTDDANAERYRTYLRQQQDRVLSAIGGASPYYRYTTALSGFAAQLDGAQVEQLRAMPGVLSVTRDTIERMDTVQTPRFLGLAGKHGVWAQHGGPKNAGRGIVIGDIDTGIWPENPSFAGKPRVPRVPGFRGICQPGERWARSICNSKIISARYFVKGFGVANVSKADFISPRDGEGHGSHTASTAAGDHGVKVHIDGQYFGKASGMAPAAKIAVYKALWTAPDPDNSGGSNSDLVAAVNQATQDGVDVINYSISGSQDYTDPVELAFLGAASAGIFVATSAGNSGPTASTVAHPSPWTTDVAASTHIRIQGAVRLGNGKSYVGSMISDQAVSKRRLVLSSRVAKPSADPTEASLCFLGTLDPKQVKNRIVVCVRGTNDRVEKSAEVKRAGGVGMVLVNPLSEDVDSDFHAVPTVHLDYAPGQKVVAYVKKAGPKARASIDPSGHDNNPVPQIAGFSSRGPLPGEVGDLLKPDLSAPGVDVIAAVAPPFNSGRRWDVYSGTSMAAPHIAGLAALIMHLRPNWSPAIIKSAMMTSAYNLSGPHGPFAQGAGHVNPRRFLDPGLVYDSRFDDWFGILTGVERLNNVNLPSIGVSSLIGSTTIRRTVTNIGGSAATYKASIQGLPGIKVQVKPAKLRIGAGRSKSFKVTFTSTSAARFNHYEGGSLVWRSHGYPVRSPLVVRPAILNVPGEVTSSQVPSGQLTISGQSGFTGSLDVATVGLQGAVPQARSVDEGNQDVTGLTVPAGTAVARVDAESTDPNDDIDLFLLDSAGNLVAQSATSSGHEQVTVEKPAPGTYTVVVDGFTGVGGAAIPYTFTQWAVHQGDKANLTLSPDPVAVTSGEPFSLTASWSTLTANKSWFGYVNYVGRGNRTYVTIN